MENSINPIHANQIVGLDVTSECADVECKTLPNYIEDLYTQLCELKNETYETDCLTSSTRVEVINELISKVCTLESSLNTGSTGSGNSGNASVLDLSTLNGALSDNWLLRDNNSIIISGSNFDIIQAILSRVIALEDILKAFNTRMNQLETMYNDLKVEIDNKPCC